MLLSLGGGLCWVLLPLILLGGAAVPSHLLCGVASPRSLERCCSPLLLLVVLSSSSSGLCYVPSFFRCGAALSGPTFQSFFALWWCCFLVSLFRWCCSFPPPLGVLIRRSPGAAWWCCLPPFLGLCCFLLLLLGVVLPFSF